MLIAVGEAPLNSLDGGYLEAAVATTILDAVDKEVQSTGWNFNSEYNKLFPNTLTGEISLPSNILRADATIVNPYKDMVQRGLRMYDRTSNTYTINEDVYLDVVVQLIWDEIPEPAKQYIIAKATRKHQDNMVGSDSLHQVLVRNETEALIALKEYNEGAEDNNIFDWIASNPYRRYPSWL